MTDVRPSKRRKLLSEVFEETKNRSTQRFVLEQIDLETGIRRRLEETAISRMTWALHLQQSLRTGNSSQELLNDDAFDYQTLAFEALHAAEAPILPVLSHEALPSRLESSNSKTSLSISTPASTALDILSSSRASSRSTRHRSQPVGLRAPAKKLMYLRNTAYNPPTLAKLACPDCSRSDMTNVQGLYNHCRLRHKLEFGSHDECIRASAVKVPPEEEAWVIENGIELPGVSLPSLRSLFEMAVGVEKEAEGHSPSPAPRAENAGQVDAVATSTHLSRTLGHHIDTPALATFLGREVKRRSIAVHAEEEVDVEKVPYSGLRGWRKPYMHRRKAVPEVASPEPQFKLGLPPAVSLANADATASQHSSAMSAMGSRFHFTARMTIGDRSLWLPPSSRDIAPEGHTHRCMVYVDSPSYSLHASAFISRLSVRSLTEPPPSPLREPAVVTAYPFAVSLTTDRPFLAELTLTIVGERNPDIEIQHWVELDPFKHEKSVLGDEQVIDVELDRSTQYRAPQPPVKPADLLNASKYRASATSGSAESSAEEVLPYARLLKSLLPRFPMTSRDAKGTTTTHLPYKLVPSSQALRSLVDGRRKAIERSRAQALREAYTKARAVMPPEEASNHLELSIADVYIWLEDGGHFLRPLPAQPALPTTKDTKSQISPLCGVGLHPQVKARDGSLQPPALCPYAPPTPRLLIVDPLRSMSLYDSCPMALPSSSGDWPHSARDVLQSIDPRVIEATSRIFGALHLPQTLTIAGSATLTLATRAFIRRLLSRAVCVAHGDRSRAPGADAPGQHLLSPAHIHRAMDGDGAMRIVGSVLGNARLCPVVAEQSYDSK